MDTWIALSAEPRNQERRRSISILKSRGMAHSNQIREFTLGVNGLRVHRAERGGPDSVPVER
jgi:circadian clock protein KaiC